MNSNKEQFTKSAQGEDKDKANAVAEIKEKFQQRLIELNERQTLRWTDDMEKAKQQVLREHNQLDCKPWRLQGLSATRLLN